MQKKIIYIYKEKIIKIKEQKEIINVDDEEKMSTKK